MTVLRSPVRCVWGSVAACWFLSSLLGAAIVLAAPISAAAPAAPAPTPPFSFAPTPFALPVASASLDRQITTLLRGFRPIQRSEVLVSGEAGRDLSVQIVVQMRPGEKLDAPTLASLVQLVLSAAPGLQAERLNIAAGHGRMLVLAGQVQAQATPAGLPSSTHILLIVLIAVVVLIAAGLVVFGRSRRGEAREPLDALILEQGRALARLLRHERPELCGLVVELAGPRAARQLERHLRAERVPMKRPFRAPEARTARALIRELQERLGAGV